VIVLIAANGCSIADESGKRLDNPNDVVRLEIGQRWRGACRSSGADRLHDDAGAADLPLIEGTG